MLDDIDGRNLQQLREQMSGYTIVPTSIIDDDSLRALMQAAFAALGVIRVYTKHVGEDVELVDPVVLPIGSTVQDAANSIHKDFAKKLKFARVWGEGKHDGQRVQLDFHLSDRDIIEFHI
jgi:ribosome-interacting GTPase 1